MQLCDHFRALVDKSIARTPPLDAAAIEARYAKEFADTQPAQRYTVLYNLIRDALKSPSQTGLSFQQLRGLRKALMFQSVAALAVDPYVDIAHRIQDACRHDFSRPFSEEEAWLDAIDAARSCVILHGAFPDVDIRTGAVTEAARRLLADGYRVLVEDDHFHLDPNEFDRLCSDIEADIRTIGGGIVLVQIFSWLRDSQQYEFERFIPGRTFLNHIPRLPSVPIGHLLNLGVKHLNNEPIRDDRVAARIWKRIAERARDLCALYDIEPYHNIEDIVLAPREVPAYLSSIARFDHLFALRQWRPSEAVRLLKGVLDFIEPTKMQNLLGWSLDDACHLAEIAFAHSSGRDMEVIRDDQIVAVGGIDAARWRMMRQHFVHDFGAANRGYAKPLDADKSDFGFKPLIEVHRKNLLLISPSMCALAFFEAITRLRLSSAG
jgi:hypothetical protein